MASHRIIALLTFCTALSSGLIAGVFFAFSTFVMNALARLPPAQGIAAMQSINVAVFSPWFMGIFLGTGASCIVLAISGLLGWAQPGAAFRVIGSALYLVGALGVTLAFNVPRNEALSLIPPEGLGAPNFWMRYVAEWTSWNHVRGVATFIASALLTVAAARRGLP
ncbi:MAG: DUF1772 domain-containing protein [Myxococcota bacterium]|nr:DUF1772 domain-containing protein [Myxococcota bacterium]